MASPFNVFRKHQKVILVGAGVLCMFVFVIGDVLFQIIPTGASGNDRTGADDVAVRFDSGQLTHMEMDGLQTRRNILQNFLLMVEQEGFTRSGGTTPVVQRLGVTRDLYRPVQEEIVLRHLLAQRASDAGIVVSDEVINQYLSQLAQGQLSSEELRGFVSNLEASGRRVSMNYIFEAIRDEMLADAYLDSYGQSVQTVTPAQRWEDWRKLNDRVVIESLALPVGNFVDKVADPTDEELRKFYETYKDREPSIVRVQPFTELPSPDPGFRIPRKVAIHYIEADHQAVAKTIESQITEEEIQQYYDQHKDPQFVREQLDLGIEGTDTSAAQGTEGLPPEPSEPGAASSTDPNAASETPPANALDAIGPSTPDQNEASQPPATDQNGAAQSGAQNEDESTPTTADEPPLEEPSQSSRLDFRADDVTHFVVFQPNGPTEPVTNSSGPDVTEATEASEEGAAPLPAAPGTPPDGAGTVQPVPPSTTGAPAPSSPIAGASQEGLPPEPPEPAKEFLPLDAVRDEIRQTLARDRVEQKLLEIMPLINGELLTAFRDYEDRRLDAEEAGKNPDDVPPPDLHLQQVAEKHGLVAKQTAPLSFLELRETPVGKSMVRERSAPYSQYAFVQSKYEPAWTVGIPESIVDQIHGGFTQYIAFKVDDTPARTPALAEIRDDVVRVYKRVKAREHALAEAQALAKKADAAGSLLKDQFAQNGELKPIESDPFSWYESQFDSQFHLGRPYGVDHAGPEFFEKVFSLEPGKNAAVFNHDQSIAYVVQLARHQQSEDALRNRFLIEGNRRDRFPQQDLLNALRGIQLRHALEESILAEAGVQWFSPATLPAEAA